MERRRVCRCCLYCISLHLLHSYSASPIKPVGEGQCDCGDPVREPVAVRVIELVQWLPEMAVPFQSRGRPRTRFCSSSWKTPSG